ncbi:unnamed protein product [Gongylonema pulchrum]|uniref:EGF_CA domain-containing protein n=1 Tax=Gongylonema pulchrum TaxID=637853 RepID=A0A183CXQ1_9BILA|nr:unnamed protein product [Gongylonema pulchrum]
MMKSEYNEDLGGMYKNQWNVSCSCPKSGYVYRFDVKQCVDVNECFVFIIDHSECVNLEGSYSCVCQLGYIPARNACKPVHLTSAVWRGPAFGVATRTALPGLILMIISSVLASTRI